MKTRQFSLNETQLEELKRAYKSAENEKAKRRYKSVRLYGKGRPVSEIMEKTGCRRSSLMEWCRAYQQRGLSGLRDGRVGGNRSLLKEPHMSELRDRLWRTTPSEALGTDAKSPDGVHWTLEDVRRAIKMWHGVTWKNRTSYYRLLEHCNFEYDHSRKVYLLKNEQH